MSGRFIHKEPRFTPFSKGFYRLVEVENNYNIYSGKPTIFSSIHIFSSQICHYPFSIGELVEMEYLTETNYKDVLTENLKKFPSFYKEAVFKGLESVPNEYQNIYFFYR